MSELYMDMKSGTREDRVLAAINNMRQIKQWMKSQSEKHREVQILLVNDSMDRMADAMLILLERERRL